MDFRDIGIEKSEFMAKTQFLYIIRIAVGVACWNKLSERLFYIELKLLKVSRITGIIVICSSPPCTLLSEIIGLFFS